MPSQDMGPTMALALDYIKAHPGCCAADVGRAVQPDSNRRHAVKVVDRLLRKRLVVVGPCITNNNQRSQGLYVPSESGLIWLK